MPTRSTRRWTCWRRVADRISVINAGRLIGTLDPHGVDIERAFFALVHRDDPWGSGSGWCECHDRDPESADYPGNVGYFDG